jgi:WD40 repeat protein
MPFCRLFCAPLALFLLTTATPGGQAIRKPNAAKVPPSPLLTLHTEPWYCFQVHFSPDGKHLATPALLGDVVEVWDAVTGKNRRPIRNNGEALAFSPDGKRLAAGGYRSALTVWEVKTGKCVLRLAVPYDYIDQAAFSPCGRFLAAVGSSYKGSEKGVVGEVQIWDLRTGKQRALLEGKGAGVVQLAYSPDGKRLAVGQRDGTVLVWDLRSRSVVRTLRGDGQRVGSMAFSPDGTRLVTTGSAVRVWELAGGKGRLISRRPKWDIAQVAFSPDGKSVLGVAGVEVRDAQGDRDLQWLEGAWVWELASGKETEIRCPGEPGAKVYSVSLSPDGRRLAVGSGHPTVENLHGTIKIWSLGQLAGR